jgi:predicted MFS family arabinose efflux permease
LGLSPIANSVASSFPATPTSNIIVAAAVYGLATAVSALFLVPHVDRIEPHRALIYGLVIFAIALGISSLAPSLIVLCTGQALAGVAAGCALPSIYALSVDVAPRGRESETLGIVLIGWTLSLVLGVSLAALIADQFSWRAVFGTLAGGASSLAFGVAHTRWPRRRPRQDDGSPLTVLRVQGVAPALLSIAAYMTAFYGFYAYLGPHLTGVLGVSTSFAGLAPCAYGLGFGIAAPLDRLIDRYGSAIASRYIFLTLSVVYAVLALASRDPLTLVGACVALGIANHLGLNLLVSGLAALDRSRRGALMGLYSAVTYLTVTAGVLAYRPLFIRFGLSACAVASAALVLFVLAISAGETAKARPTNARNRWRVRQPEKAG